MSLTAVLLAGVAVWTLLGMLWLGKGSQCVRLDDEMTAAPDPVPDSALDRVTPDGEPGMVAAHRPADENGAVDHVFALGARLEGRGQFAAAEAAYRHADRRGDANAACRLGALLEARGELTAAEVTYQRAAQRGLAGGARNLGLLLERRGDVEGAQHAFGHADHLGDALGAYHHGRLLARRGDLAHTREALQRACERGHPELAELAQAALVELDTLIGAGSVQHGATEQHRQ